jgi:hypothetical protein
MPSRVRYPTVWKIWTQRKTLKSRSGSSDRQLERCTPVLWILWVYRVLILQFEFPQIFPSPDRLTNVHILLSMLRNLDIQCKAQAEIDRSAWGAELLRFEDEESLPFIVIVKEVFSIDDYFVFGRFSLTVWLSAPHSNTSDDVYNGYHIPAGSVQCDE